MTRRIVGLIGLLLLFWVVQNSCHARSEDGWIPLFDGHSLDGWKAAEHPDSFRVEGGKIVADGPRAHLFYVGDVQRADWRNFELKADVMAAPGGNSGVYFHTRYQETGYPRKGYEVQINNTYPRHGEYYEYKKTGSLYGVRNQFKSIVNDNEWFTMHVAVTGKRVRISINDTLLVDYTEPTEPPRSGRQAARRLSRGTFALQCHDPNSKVYFGRILVKPLPDNISVPPRDQAEVDATDEQMAQLQRTNFPLVDFHVHLKGGLTLEQALAKSRATGINYGIAVNCGVGFPTTNDEGVNRFVESMKGKPAFYGMQAEGREWVKLFSKEAIAQFDYVFTDAMTFTDDQGRRTRLWIDDEVHVDDPQRFMDMLVDRIETIMNNEPIDIYVNPTFLPNCIQDDYDRLWTDDRMKRVIDVLVKNGVALEINSRYRIPRPVFIKKAKAAGVKFTFGTNNGGRELGRLEYCLDMIQQCGLTSDDMFMP